MAQKPVLGKGLASLFPGIAHPPSASTPAQATESAQHTGSGAQAAGPATTLQQQEFGNRERYPGISLINVDDIQVNDYQPRRDFDGQALQELSQSIQVNGIIQPLIVRKMGNGSYQLIAGERRLRASKLAGLKQVPIVIRRSTDREALELALIENIQRENLNCVDEALAYFQLMQDFSLTQEEVAQRVGKERTTVANHLRLLRLPEAIIDDLKKQILSFGHGKALLALEDTDLRLRARAVVVQKRLSVRDTEALVEQLKLEAAQDGTTPVKTDKTPASPSKTRLGVIAQELTRHWSTRVELKGSEHRGKVVLHYGSRQELDRILEAMQNQRV